MQFATHYEEAAIEYLRMGVKAELRLYGGIIIHIMAMWTVTIAV
jgi:hypothetical protein